MGTEIQLDAFPPAKMVSRMEDVGLRRARLDVRTIFALAVLAGAFVATGAVFYTVVTTGLAAAGMGFGLIQLLGGLAFCLGFVGVVVTGAELFAANNLVTMAFAGGRVGIGGLLRHWVTVYAGNCVGSILAAAVMFLTRQYLAAGGALGANVLSIADGKCSLGFLQAIVLGMMASALVSLAGWLSLRGRSTADKVLAIVFPVTAFAAAGFEYSIANTYFIPVGLLVKSLAPQEFWSALQSLGKTPADFAHLTWGAFFLKNLLPVTIGNVIGGAGLAGLVYRFLYVRSQKAVETRPGVAAKILVVDDDPDFVDITRMVLTGEGYEVASATDAAEAFQTMKEKRPDLVLLDIMMTTPLEGVALSRRIAADPDLKDLPVVMISSIDSSRHAQLLPDDLHVPTDAWISKPVDPDQLLRTIKRFLA